MRLLAWYSKSGGRSLRAFVFTSALAIPGSALGAEATTTMDVSLVIEGGCSISASSMVFPTPTALESLSTTAQIDIICTNGTPFEIGLDAGAHSTDVAARELQDAASLETITYSVYKSGSHAVVWGNTQGVDTVTDAGSGFVQQFSAYGQIPVPATIPSAGTYTDTINAFVYF